MSKKWIKTVYIVFALFLLPFITQAAEPIKIGALLSVTGPMGFLGDTQLKALNMLVKKFNAQGGVLGRPIELISYDDVSDTNNAVTFFKRLVESDKVDMIIAASSTGSSMAILPFVEKAGLPMISPAPGMGLTDPVKKWVFKTPHGDNLVAQRVLMDMKKRGFTKIALFTDTASSGVSGRKEILAALSKYGFSALADETFAPKDTDMTPQLTKIRGIPGVQAIFLYCGAGPGGAIVTKNRVQLGMKVPLYLNHANASKEYLRMAGEAAEGVRVASGAAGMPEAFPEGHPSRSICEAYYKEYKETYKVDALPYSTNTCDALVLFVDAIKRAGSTDKVKVRDAIEQTKNFPAMMGIFNFSPTDHAGVDLDSLAILEVKGGKFTPVR